MRRCKLLIFAALALLSFGAVAATTALAADENTPQILVLAGEAKELKGTLTGGVSKLEDLAGKTIEGKKVEAQIENCKNETNSVKDTTLCKEVKIDFFEIGKATVSCRSETLEKTKDPVGTLLALLNLHLAAGLNLPVSSELVPILTAQVLGVDKAEDLEMNCGGVVSKILGVLACALLKGLVNTETLELLCKTSAQNHDPELADCTVLCEAFGKIGLKSTLGVEPNDSWESIHLEGKLNKDIFIDD